MIAKKFGPPKFFTTGEVSLRPDLPAITTTAGWTESPILINE